MQVNLLYLEETHGDLAEQKVERCTLRTLRVFTGAYGKPAACHACILLTHHRKNFQGKLFLPETGKMFNVANIHLGMSEGGSLQFHTADTFDVKKKRTRRK